MSSLTRILVVDENPHFRTAVVEFLRLQKSFHVVGIAGDKKSALAQAEQYQPDVILLNLNLGEPVGPEHITPLRVRLPAVKIIVLSMMNDKYCRSVIQDCGADGFVSRVELRQTLYSVILNLGISSSRNRGQVSASP